MVAHRHPPSRTSSRRAVVAAASLSALVAAGFTPGTQASAATPQVLGPRACPSPFPTGQLQRDQPVTGRTVSEGTQPDSLSGSVVGTLEDGIAPGLDMIIVKLAGSVITDAEGKVDRGIWAGMSGSPIYAEDGRLIGAVSYGLSWSPSDYAGVTPAGEMYALRDYENAAVRTVALPPRLAARMDAQGATPQQVGAGMRRLPLPVSVSGVQGRRLERGARVTDFDRPLVGGGTARTSETAIPITAGGNVAAMLSYGDATIGGIGTATAVCGGQVLAFGHPAFFRGRSSLTMHGADALFVQRDAVFGSWKVANPAAPSGTITQDRLAGILGVDGRLPETTSITSTIRSGDRVRTGGSEASEQKALDFVTFVHLLGNIDRVFDHYGPGSARAVYTMTVRRADDTELTYTRGEVYADDADLAWPLVFDVLEDIWRIQENRFEPVEITSIAYEGTLDARFRAYQIGRVLVRQSGDFLPVGNREAVRARAGRSIVLRVTLTPRDGANLKTATVQLAVDVPPRAAGSHGELVVLGGDNRGERRSSGGPTSLRDMLATMRAEPGNDSVQAQLRLGRRGRDGTDSATKQATAPVSGGRGFEVYVTR